MVVHELLDSSVAYVSSCGAGLEFSSLPCLIERDWRRGFIGSLPALQFQGSTVMFKVLSIIPQITLYFGTEKNEAHS